MAATAASRSRLLLLAAFVLVALALQSFVVPIDADVSWLITVSERVLAGQRLYVDVFEVNPPASVWLYLPQVALAHLLHLRPEAVIALVTALLAASSTWITARLIEPGRTGGPSLLVLAAIGFVALILPGGLFAQREHYALLLALPVAATMARSAERRPISNRAVMLAGIASGAMIVIKPHFVFAVALPAAYCAWKARDWRSLFLAAAAAAIVVALYAAAIFALAPEYLALVPMLKQVYGPMRQPLHQLLSGITVIAPLALAAAAFVLGRDRWTSLLTILVLIMAGFTIAVLIQGKGYWNHALPALGLGLVAIALTCREDRLGTATFAVLAAGLTASTLIIQPPKGLVAALRQVAPPHPTIITLGSDLSIGHPAVRLVDGRWVGTRAALFTAAGVYYREVDPDVPLSPQLGKWCSEDLALLENDIQRHHPDIVLVERSDIPWLGKDPVFRLALRNYRRVARTDSTDIWRRTKVWIDPEPSPPTVSLRPR